MEKRSQVTCGFAKETSKTHTDMEMLRIIRKINIPSNQDKVDLARLTSEEADFKDKKPNADTSKL